MMNCKHCKAPFEITPDDEVFYQKMKVPEPTHCPQCRKQRRMAFRNEKTLYKRKCDLCKKNIISIYSADKIFPVYCQECFWGDRWNAGNYSLDFNLAMPFFEQFKILLQKTPRLAIINKQSENSDYCNYSFANKNCYLTFGNHYEEDCMYGRYSTKNKDCLDYLFLYQCELCYECVYSKNCYRSVYLDHCEDCQDCFFSTDLKSCKNCLFSSNLRHKQYYIFNKPYSKEEYFKLLTSYRFNSRNGLKRTKKYFLEDFRRQFPFRSSYQNNCENCTGSNLTNCKNLKFCFDATNCENVSYAIQSDECYSCMDMTCMGYDRSEQCYETIGCSGTFSCIACDSCWQDSDLMYCTLCFSSKNCFGCTSLQRKQYCILNKQCSKEEYEILVPQIIEQMKKNKEWGEFFPMEISPFAYNETIAQEYFPMSKDQALKAGFQWKKLEEQDASLVSSKMVATAVPETIGEVAENGFGAAIECAESKQLFKIQKQEFEFYKKLDVPLPVLHPDIRLRDRLKIKNPAMLWQRTCAKCQTEIQTSYAPERPETVYCEKCYLEAVY